MKAELFFEPNIVQLLKSIQQNEVSDAKALIAEGAELNVIGNEGITPLLWLIAKKDKQAVQLALDLGADPNFNDADGDNAVNLVVRNDDSSWLTLLLKAGGDPNSINRNGMPALFGAMGAETKDNIETLLAYGADVNLKDRSGRNSAFYPTYIMEYELAYYFIQQGADPLIYSTGGANLAWRVHEALSEGIIAPDSINYPWVMKIKQHLIEQGVEFPPPSPKEVRTLWEKNGKPAQ